MQTLPLVLGGVSAWDQQQASCLVVMGGRLVMLSQRQRSAKVKAYRAVQAKVAWDRDEGLCQRCGAEGSPPHHVYGHGNFYTRLLYEHSSKQVTLCLACHGRCHHDKPKIYRDEMIQVLEQVLKGKGNGELC